MTTLLLKNRRLLMLAIVLIIVTGLSAMTVLPRREDPVLTSRVAIINTMMPGAKASRVESLVTEVIEEELEEIPEIKELQSISREGISTITIELRDDVYDAEPTWQRVRAKLDDAEPQLPTTATDPDFDDLEVSAYAAIYALKWTADSEVNYAILRRLAEELEQELLSVDGTREIDTFGDPEEEILVEIDQAKLATVGLSVNELARQIAASDAKEASGQIRGPQNTLLLEVDAELDSIARVAAIPIRYGNGDNWMRLSDLAKVDKDVRRPLSKTAMVDGVPAVALGVYLRDEIRIDTWSLRVDQAIEQFRATLPPGIELSAVFEQSPYVEKRLESLAVNLAAGAGAVMLVIWLMMGWRNALVVGSALPLASLMVLGAMRILEIPIHQMSVTGLIIALGLLIDNAIVMTDEVSSRLRKHEGPLEAIHKSVAHLAGPLFGSTVTTALSFAPIALMPGPAGEFVGSIAVSVILAVASSLLLALTITPTIAAMLAPQEQPKQRWWSQGFDSPRLSAIYRSVLGWLFRWPALALLLAMAAPTAGFIAATGLAEQFFPPADRDQFHVQVELPAVASIDATQRTVSNMRELMLEHENVDRVDWFLGESAPSFYYNLSMNMRGVPKYAQAIVHVHELSKARDTIREIQHSLDDAFPQARSLVRQLEQGPPFDAPVEVRLFGPDLERLAEIGAEVRYLLSTTPEVLHTASDLDEALPKLAVNVDESRANIVGLDNRLVARQLNDSLEGAVGGSIIEATEELPVRVRIANDRRGSVDQIASIDLVSTRTQRVKQLTTVPLSSIASLDLRPEISSIPHFNGERMNEVRAYITAGVLPAEVLSGFQKRLAQTNFEMPDGYRLEFGGEADKRDQAVGNLVANVGVLTVLMVATLVLSFNSFRMAGLIGAVGFLAVGLGLGALAVFGYPFGFMAIVGSMGLAGVAINDSIVVLAALRAHAREIDEDRAELVNVVVEATRHVIATTLTTIAGFLPLILSGGEFWPPLATTIAGGVAGATLLALVFVPAAYLLFGQQRTAAPAAA